MKANVIYGDLNTCGGGERLSLVTMQALSEMGIDFDLTTLKSPDLSKLENAFGKNLVSVMRHIKKINIINIIEELRVQLQQQQKQQGKSDYYYDYDITINTHGDGAPYFHPTFSKDNTITYCHYPSAKYHIESENIDYLKELFIDIKSNNSTDSDNNNNNNENNEIYKSNYSNNSDDDEYELSYKIKEYFRILKYGYWNMMRNSNIVTNSEFTCKAIVDALAIDTRNNNIHILRPPVDIETFHNSSDSISEKKEKEDHYDHKREDFIITVSRIAPYKEIENAIKLAKILKNKNIGKGMIIVGNLYDYFEYYLKLKQMVVDLSLTDYVKFEINVSLDKLLSIMKESKVYFHPRIGEHFGIAVVEAMAAGLIPIVSSLGGPAEFVPRQYQFNTIEQAAEIVSQALRLPYLERVQLSNSANKFSTSRYIKGFQQLVNELLLLSHRRK